MDTGQSPDVKINLQTLKLILLIVEWAWKIVPILYFLFSFYRNQDDLTKRNAAMEASISNLEKAQNEQARRISDVKAELDALHQKSEEDRQFYLQLEQRNRR